MKRAAGTVLFLVLLLSVGIRLYQLSQNPQGFDQTEAAFGYNAYSILKSGRDEDSTFLPLVIVSIGDFKLAGYSYWQIPFIAVFGLNEFASRLSTAVAGIISLVFLYLLVSDLIHDRKLALLTVFFTSISPWHLILSRMAYDPMIALMALLASSYFFVRWYKKGALLSLFVSMLAVSLAVMTYYAVWVLLPFMMIVFWVYLFNKTGIRGRFFLPLMITVVPLILFVRLLSLTQGQRLGQDSTFQITAYPLLQEQIREDQQEFPLPVTRAFHNKLVFYPQILAQQFFKNLSFDFLFLRGDILDRRFWVPYQGVLYLWTAPFLLLGILYFWKNRSVLTNVFVLGLIMVIFGGSSFSEFGSETERTLFAAPVFSFLISYGLLSVYRIIHHSYSIMVRPVFIGLGLLLAGNVAYFNHQYFWHANVHEPWGKDFGAKEMVYLVRSLGNNYRRVVVPDSTYIFFYYFSQVDPAQAWWESGSRLTTPNYLGRTQRAQIGNFLTMPIECPANGKLDVLYVCRGTRIPRNSQVIHVISYRDEQPAFIFLTFTQTEAKDPAPKNVSYMENSQIIPDTSDRYW